MPPTSVNDGKHWRDRAAEMRILSIMMRDIETRAIMIRLADEYDALADRADVRNRANEKPQPERARPGRS
jgi:hypothetical protein